MGKRVSGTIDLHSLSESEFCVLRCLEIELQGSSVNVHELSKPIHG